MSLCRKPILTIACPSDRDRDLSGGHSVGFVVALGAGLQAHGIQPIPLSTNIVADEGFAHLILTQPSACVDEILAQGCALGLHLAKIVVAVNQAEVESAHVPGSEVTQAQWHEHQKNDI